MAQHTIGQYKYSSSDTLWDLLYSTTTYDVGTGYAIIFKCAADKDIVIYKNESNYQVIGKSIENITVLTFMPKIEGCSLLGYLNDTGEIIEITSLDIIALYKLTELMNNKISLSRLIHIGFVSSSFTDKYYLLINGSNIIIDNMDRPYELEGLEIASLMVFTQVSSPSFIIDYQGISGDA